MTHNSTSATLVRVLDREFAIGDQSPGDREGLQTGLSMLFALVVLIHWMICRRRQPSYEGDNRSSTATMHHRRDFADRFVKRALFKANDGMYLILSVASFFLTIGALQLFENINFSGGFLLALSQFALLLAYFSMPNASTIVRCAKLDADGAYVRRLITRSHFHSRERDSSSVELEDQHGDTTYPLYLTEIERQRQHMATATGGFTPRQQGLFLATALLFVFEIFRPSNNNEQEQNRQGMMFRLVSKIGTFGALVSVFDLIISRCKCLEKRYRPNHLRQILAPCACIGVLSLNILVVGLQTMNIWLQLLTLAQLKEDGDNPATGVWWLPILPFWGTFVQLFAAYFVVSKEDLPNSWVGNHTVGGYENISGGSDSSDDTDVDIERDDDEGIRMSNRRGARSPRVEGARHRTVHPSERHGHVLMY